MSDADVLTSAFFSATASESRRSFQPKWRSLFVPFLAWPSAGEIDIVEGVNDQGPNASTLHTSPNCFMTDNTMVDTG